MKIYLDESGDLGYTQGSSDHFIIALLITSQQKRIRNCFKRIRQRRIKKKYQKSSELKFYNSSPIIRKRILDCVASSNIQIAYIVFRKNKINRTHDLSKVDFYSMLTINILQRVIMDPGLVQTQLIVDKTFSKPGRIAFSTNIIDKIQSILEKDIQFEIIHRDSQKDPCLQAVDFIAGAIYQYYEHNNADYIGIIEDKIKTMQQIKE